MDNEQNTPVNETGTIEANDAIIESDVSKEVKPVESIQEENAETTTEETQPEKIKVGEKEYSPEELKEYVEKVETQKIEQEKTQYQPRELQVIEADIQRAVSDFEADATSIQKKFLAKATPPVQEFINPDTGLLEQRYSYSAEEAFQHGLQKGEWDYFISCLSPQDAVAFQNDKNQFAQNYNQKMGYLQQEQNYIQHTEAKKADIGKWDSYIDTNAKQNPSEAYILNELKNDYEFDDKSVEKFLNVIRKARALEQNTQQLGAENDSAKADMMNSTISGSPKPQGTQKIFTAAEIGRMTPAEFARNEKAIDAQNAKGLIK